MSYDDANVPNPDMLLFWFTFMTYDNDVLGSFSRFPPRYEFSISFKYQLLDICKRVVTILNFN